LSTGPTSAPGTVVAVLGAGGTMGQGIAANLAAAGIVVRAWNRTPQKIEELASIGGITPCATPAEAVAGAGFVLTMLSDAEATLAAVDGPDGIAAAAEGTVWIQMGTIGLPGTDSCAELADRLGLVFVDAPVQGTRQPAEEGQLVVMASGPEETRALVEPLFDAIGKRTLWLGPAGAGTRMKIVVNSWIVSVVEGGAEMLALAEALAVDPRQVLDAISGGPLDLPYLQMKGKAMIERDFNPSFRLALAAKDAGLAVAAAEEAGLELPMLEAIAARMATAARDHGDEDLAAVYLAIAPGD
jgi:3-hydroxyisobutyrate dehydrogenase